MSLVSCKCVVSYLITFFPRLFNLPIPILTFTIVNLSFLLTRAFVCLLCTCWNHLNLSFLVLSTTKITHTLSQVALFLILSLVCPHIHLNILLSYSGHQVLGGQHSAPSLSISPFSWISDPRFLGMTRVSILTSTSKTCTLNILS